jgi:hypothetical protein
MPEATSGSRLRCVQFSPRRLSHLKHLPDDGRGSFHAFEATGAVRAQPERREGGLHDVRRPQVNPVLVWERVERDHPVPVSKEPGHGRLIRLSVRADERVAAPLTVGLRLGVRHRLEQRGRLRLFFRGQRVQDVGDLVVPASLLLALNGAGIEKDVFKGRNLLLLAAKQNHAEAQFQLGHLYRKVTFPRFYRHLKKEENDEIGGANDHQDTTVVYGGL